MLNRAGFGKKIVTIPAGPAILALRILEALRLSPVYKWAYDTITTDSFVAIEKAERVLGYAPKYSNKDALVRNYEWYIAHLDQFENASGVSHRVPWKQGILKLAKIFSKRPSAKAHAKPQRREETIKPFLLLAYASYNGQRCP